MIVQETLARLLAARERLDQGAAGPYAIVTARNLVSSRWRRADVATLPPRALAHAHLEPKLGHQDTFHVRLGWGDPLELPEHTDTGTVERGYVAVTYLCRLADDRDADVTALADHLGALPIHLA